MKKTNRNPGGYKPQGVGGRPQRPYQDPIRQPSARRPQEHHVSVTLSRRALKIIIACIACAAAAAVLFILAHNGVFGEIGQPKEPKATQLKFSADDMDVSNISLSGQKIIIDAAHSPANPGNSTADGVNEETLTLTIADKVRNNLIAKGANVVMTRDLNSLPAADEAADSAARYAQIRVGQGDMVVSIHMNWYEDGTAAGPQTFFREQGAKGKRIATAVQDMLNYKLEFENPRMPIVGAYEILGVGAQPSAVVECGFLSNPEEAALLKTDEYQQKLADAITDGILLYRKRFADIIEDEKLKATASAAAQGSKAPVAQAPAQPVTPHAAAQTLHVQSQTAPAATLTPIA